MSISSKSLGTQKKPTKVILASSEHGKLYQFSIENKTWSKLGITVGGKVLNIFEINNIFYVVGSQGITTMSPDKQYYKVPTDRIFFTASKVKGLILLFEHNGNNCLFDPINKKWSETIIRTKRSGFSAVEFLDKVWIVGGYERDCNKILNTTEVYDPVTKTMTLSQVEMVQARRWHKVIVYNDKMFVFGGFGVNGALNSVEMYSPETEKFVLMAPMRILRYEFGCCRVGNLVYVIGGSDNINQSLKSVEIYNLDTDTWTEEKEFPAAALIVYSCAVNKKLYNIN